ncbi:MEI2-like 4-like protein [Drosera capensis]
MQGNILNCVMPSEKMNQQEQSVSTASYFPDETQCPAERQVGFWKSEPMLDPSGVKIDRLSSMPSSMPVASLPVEKTMPVEPHFAKHLNIHDASLPEHQKGSISLPRHSAGADRAARTICAWSGMDNGYVTMSELNTQSRRFSNEDNRRNMLSAHQGNGAFSSSLSELFSRNLRLSVNNKFYGHSIDTITSPHEEEPLESLEEIEAQTIGNLLPNDDDLFSGVVYGEQVGQRGGVDDTEDLDLFSSVGGMDLGDDNSYVGRRNNNFHGVVSPGQLGGTDFSIAREHPFGEFPSRTLFVRNINITVDDLELRAVFEQHGDVRTMYTASKHRGFVMISYYDIRAARNALKALQGKALRQKKLDIHYSIPKDTPSDKDLNDGTLLVFNLNPSVSNANLLQIFGTYGEIKEIGEIPNRMEGKFIEFYDLRSAEAALHALNLTEIAGKRIRLEPSRYGGRSNSALELCPDVLVDKASLYGQGSFLHRPISSASMNSEINFGTRSIQASIGPVMENAFRHGISSSVPSNLSSYLRIDPGNHHNLSETGASLDQINYNFRGGQTFHPHSFPDHPDGLFKGSPSNSGFTMPSTIGSLPSDKVESILSGRISTNGISNDLSSGYGSPVNQYMWSSSNHVQSPSLMRPNFPSVADGVSAAHSPSRLHGLPRAPARMLKPIIPNHHVGSAPTVNHHLWDGRHAHLAGSPDASGFQQGSLGNMRLSGSPLHQMDFISHNAFAHLGGNGMDLPIPSRHGVHSNHHRSMLQSGRAQINSLSGSYEPGNERVRSRRSDSNSSQADNKKQFELDLDRISRGEDNRTTLMIKNIPNNHIIPFYETFNGKKWEKFNSEKVASLAYARIQGKQALVAHFQNSSLLNEDKRCQPILFHTDGRNAGDQVPFPMGVKIGRASKTRSSNIEDNLQESGNKEESPVGDSSPGSGKDS